MKSVHLAAIVAIALACPQVARAAKHDKHLVKEGDSIAEIARYHGVDQDRLIEANGLGKNGVIQPGDTLVIPKILVGGWTRGHNVKSGDTVARIAKRYRVSRRDLREVNRIGPKGRLKIGRRLAIPKGKRVNPDEVDVTSGEGKKKAKPAAKWNGKATFVRVRGNERKRMTMFDKRGRVRAYAQRTITRLARSKKNKVRRIHPRLVRLLGKVAEHFPGKEIEIISGYRPHRRGKKRSQHARGKAMDFRVDGVANIDLYNFVKTFKKIGAGYYPNSTFVHLDVRDRKYLWTDLSGRGEPANYLKAGEPGSAEAPSGEKLVGHPDPENFPDED